MSYVQFFRGRQPIVKCNNSYTPWVRGFVSVGRAVASDTRGLWFKSSNRRKSYWKLLTVHCKEKPQIKKMRPGMAHLKKQYYTPFAQQMGKKGSRMTNRIVKI